MADSILKVGVVGGLGLMASPMAKHWAPGGPVQVLRVQDRGKGGERRDRCRQAWKTHGAQLVSSFSDVVGDGGLDGVFVCCGKNGDDVSILRSLCEQRALHSGARKFICHMSTVSTGFTRAAHTYCNQHNIDYVNYPLTGGVLGAEQASMLILASGSPSLYERLQPALAKLGRPRHFGERVDAAAEVKLIGHLMVFNGLNGICSALATHAECFENGEIGSREQSDFFDFLNSGAGGTRQWDLVLKMGISQNVWDQPFLLKYAVVDALYVAQLCLERQVSRLAVEAVLNVVLAFSYVLNKGGVDLATHSIVREMLAGKRDEFDQFLLKHAGPRENLVQCLDRCVQSLPTEIQDSVKLDVSPTSFE